MALPPHTPDPSIDEAFVADRQMFWNSFTSFTKYSVIGLVVLLVGLYIFVV